MFLYPLQGLDFAQKNSTAIFWYLFPIEPELGRKGDQHLLIRRCNNTC